MGKCETYSTILWILYIHIKYSALKNTSIWKTIHKDKLTLGIIIRTIYRIQKIKSSINFSVPQTVSQEIFLGALFISDLTCAFWLCTSLKEKYIHQ